MEIGVARQRKYPESNPSQDGKPDGLQATHSRKVSARMSKGEPEITAVTGSNERSGSKQETMRKQSEMPNGQPK